VSEGPGARDRRLALCFGVHDHQPVGNFDGVIAEASARAYRPFFELVRRRPDVRLTVHVTGSLLEWLRERDAPTFDALGAIVASGQAELLTGGYWEPILAILPDRDKIGQVRQLSDYLKRQFGVRPRGMWLAERVWEPALPKALVEAGVEYVLVDDTHFALAGFDPDTLGGWYLTEDQGATVGVVPISQRLRYLIPFADIEESVRELEARRGQVPAVTVMDDGEKFGAWPGTWEHVYRDGWLDRFFDRLGTLDWVELATFGDVIDRVPASGRAYLPTASYREMGEWALAPGAGRDLERAKRELERVEDGARLAGYLRGGFWRSFLVKYPEVADIYWKMLRLSDALDRELARRPDDARLLDARQALWRGQANDAYWHGVFGGCYLPHLRRAIKQSLIEAERGLGDVAGRPAIGWSRGDVNGDGAEEVIVQTSTLTVTVNPDRGGTITELAWLPRLLDVADVLTRRPEQYHDRIRGATGVTPTIDVAGGLAAHQEAGLAERLDYDDARRASLVEGWFDDADVGVDPVTPWRRARWTSAAMRLAAALEEREGGLDVRLRLRPAATVEVDKHVRIHGNVVAARYRVRSTTGGPLVGTFAVQWNLALTAGHAGDRYLGLPDRPPLASTGRERRADVTLVDEWAGLALRLETSPMSEFAWGPVETVSVSESGFERIYQGTAITVAWRFDGSGTVAEVSTSLAVESR
jgi:alpha-amylase